MLGRRNLRIKVMQALYAWEMDHDIELAKLQGHLKSQIDRSVSLYNTNLLYLVEVSNYSMVSKALRMAKYVKTEADNNASTTIAANSVIQFLQQDAQFNSFVKSDGLRNYVAQDVVKELFTEMAAKDKFKEYAALQSTTPEQDKEILVYILKKVFQGNKNMQHHLEEVFINHEDDNTLLLHILSKYIETFDAQKKNNFYQSMSLWEEEKKYALDLLAKTIQNNDELVQYIEPNLKNWEMDRVAILDLILMKMAVSELKFFPTIPVKVTINEYIDISKLYSTPKSKDFVNGVLDKIKNGMKENNEIKKFGRGLME